MGGGGLKIHRYYMDQPGDSPWRRLRNRLTRRPVPRFPRSLQIQTFTGCNADCIFCPYGETYGTQPRGKMSRELFRKLIDEGARHRVRRVSPYLMNEPLMDRDLFEKIHYVRRRMPRTRILITTNGHFLTREVADRFLDLGSAVHEICVSVQGLDAAAYARTMRGSMNLERTLANIEYFIEAQRRRRQDRPRLRITMVDTALIDARAAVAYWRSRGVASRYTSLENRGGHIQDVDRMSRTGPLAYNTTCTRLFKQAYIMFNGDMVLCCVDYSRTQVLGNVSERSIEEVWNGPVAEDIRRRYLARDFADLPLCGPCRIDRVHEVSVEVDGRVRTGRLGDFDEAAV